ncbi:MAG: 2-oxo acid dehydrogenase subunit E2 [Ktedonobacteraceae bacterium]|nr:2-oxo acid dehydrogenase subunit E2 [Ktedonobacteraceae bacterium]
MMPEINMPRLSDTMQEGTIARWLKQPGDQVKKGDVLAEVETDKATMDIEAYDAGVLEQIIVKAGDTAPIGEVIAIIGSGAARPQVTAERPRAAALSATVEEPRSARAPSVENRAEVVREVPRNGGIKASPLARRMAEEHGIDLAQIAGTGPAGRIVRDDIEDYIERQRPAPVQPAKEAIEVAGAPEEARTIEAEVIPMSQMQKTIARRLTESKQTVPHFYVSNEIDMTAALEMRQKLNAAAGEKGTKISVNDMIVKACALALEQFPEVNSSFREGQFVRHKQVNIGIAVDVPQGLVVPVVRDVNVKGLRAIAREAKALIEKARNNRLTLNELQGGTFSVSNLGMMDVTDFIPVINPPEAAILAVASVRKVFVPVDGQPVLRDIMKVTVSADHRIVYGAMVARFLQEVKHLLEDVYLLLG